MIAGTRLVHVLIAKSLAETILVGTLAIVFYFSAFPPYFHGWGEATPHAIAGWAVNQAVPWERVNVQLFIDGEFVASSLANLSRPDVVSAGWALDEWHGYQFDLPALPSGFHEARVYALAADRQEVRETLQLLGDPIRFTVDENGTLSGLSKTRS